MEIILYTPNFNSVENVPASTFDEHFSIFDFNFRRDVGPDAVTPFNSGSSIATAYSHGSTEHIEHRDS